MNPPCWEHFVHEADIGVRGIGTTRAQAFEQAALAMTAVVTDPSRVRTEQAVAIACEAPDGELLLVDWLNALVFEMGTRRMLFGRYEVAIDGDAAPAAGLTLRGTAWGEAVDVAQHQPAVEVKGATYTQLAVRREPAGADLAHWLAQCVVDV